MTTRESQLVSRDDRRTVGEQFVDGSRMACRDVNVYYGEKQMNNFFKIHHTAHSITAGGFS